MVIPAFQHEPTSSNHLPIWNTAAPQRVHRRTYAQPHPHAPLSDDLTTLQPTRPLKERNNMPTSHELAVDITAASISVTPTAAFSNRHIGPTESDVAAMLRTIGIDSLSDLIAEAVPASILDPGQLTFGPALSETETIGYLRKVASKNKVLTSLI